MSKKFQQKLCIPEILLEKKKCNMKWFSQRNNGQRKMRKNKIGTELLTSEGNIMVDEENEERKREKWFFFQVALKKKKRKKYMKG